MHVRVALDSMPVTSSSDECRDHSGSQVYGLMQAPLVGFSLRSETEPPRLLAAREVVTSKDGKRHRFVLRTGLRWSDGEAASPAHFFEPFARLHDESPDCAESFWLRDVIAITPQPEGFEVLTARPRFRFAALTSLLRLGARKPGPPDARLGRFRPVQTTNDSIQLSANRYFGDPAQEPAGDPDSVEFVHIKEPASNVARFVEGAVDVTADTAFPYQLVPELLESASLLVSQPGIFVSLAFEGDISKPANHHLRARVRDALDAEALCWALGDVAIPKHDYLPTAGCLREHLRRASGVSRAPAYSPGRSVGHALRLAFDDYYPNREMCAVILHQLRAAGIRVEPVEDSFHDPSQRADVRLVLNKGIHPGELGMYHGLLFCEALRSTPPSLSRYLSLLEESESTPVLTPERVQHSASELQAILDREAAIVPLAELPGLTLSRFRHFPFAGVEQT